MPTNEASFLPGTEFLVGKGPIAIKIGDLTASGSDLVVGNQDAGTVTVLKNVGGGLFPSVGDYVAEAQIASVAVGDMDRDGINDVVVGRAAVGNPTELVAVLHNSGAANLGSPIRSNSRTSRGGLALADFNGDAQLDVAVTADDGLDILLNEGTASYGDGGHYPVGLNPTSLVTADLNRDGLVDVVVVAQDSAKVFLGAVNGILMSPLALPLVPSLASVALDDLNDDHILDAVLGKGTGMIAGAVGGFRVLLGHGDGTFEEPIEHTTGRGETSIALADINGDFRPDVISTSVWLDELSVYPNVGKDDFGPPLRLRTGARPTSLAVGDLNGDRKPDVVVTNYGSDTVSVFLNDSP